MMLTLNSTIYYKILKSSVNKSNFNRIIGKKIYKFPKYFLSQKNKRFNSLNRLTKLNFSTETSDIFQTLKFSISFPKQLKSEDYKIAQSIRITESCVEVFNLN